METVNLIIKKLSALALTMLLAFGSANAQMPTDSIVADFNEFVRLLEETHPDPYTNFGGKPFFRRAAMEVRLGLVQDSVTSTDELANRINEFLAPLEDGHTSIQQFNFGSQDEEVSKRAPIGFWAIGDGVIVENIMSDYKELIGSRLIGIEGIPFKTICNELAKRFTAENEIGRITNFMFISGFRFNEVMKTIPNVREDSITFQLLTPEGKPIDLTLPLVKPFSNESVDETWGEHTEPIPNKGNLSYQFVDDQKQTMYFRSSQIMARDALEYMHNNGMDMGPYLGRLYGMFNNDEMPEDVNEALAKIPSFSGEFEKMLLEMKKNKSKNLIIDLSGNSGGFTPIVLPTMYQMWGDKFIKEVSRFGIQFATNISPLYLKKMNTSIERLNAQMGSTELMTGDYFFTSEDTDIPDEITDEVRNQFISGLMSSVKDRLLAQKGKPVYTPEHVYVLTNPTTFSAAFHYAFYLWKMGATVAGLPSKQAPNTYMEATPFELPRTGLTGSISNSLQLFLPTDDPRAKEFTPDLMPTYEDYKHYNFDTSTELRYLLDYIKGKK